MSDAARVPSALGVRELEAVADAYRVLSSTLELGEVLDRLATITRLRLDVDVVRIWLVEDGGDTAVLRAQTGALEHDVQFQPRFRIGEGLAGQVIAEGRSLALTDVLADPRVRNRAWFEAQGIASILGSPIVLDLTPIGAIACLSRRRREFSAADVALVEALAVPAAAAVRNASLYADALARLEEIQAFQRVTFETLSSPDLETVLHAVVRETRHLLGSDAAFCSLVDPRTLEVETLVGVGGQPQGAPRYRIVPGEGLSGYMYAHGGPVRTDAYLDDARFGRHAERDEWARREGVVAAIAAPARDAEGRLVAILWGFNRRPVPFTPLHEDRLVRLAQQAVLAISRVRSLEDERRRAGETAALLEIARACTSTLELTPLLKEVSRRAAQALGVERCSVNLWHGGHLTPVMSQFADGHSDPVLWARFRALRINIEDVPAHAEAIRLKQPVPVADSGVGRLIPELWREQFGVRAALVVPLIAKDEVIGTLNLDDTRAPRTWSQAQLDLAMTIAAHVALAVANARNYADAQRRAEEVETLIAVGETVTSTLEVRAVLDAVAASAAQLARTTRVAVFELDAATGCLHARSLLGMDLGRGFTLAPGQGAAGAAVLRRAPVWSSDVLAAPPPGFDQPEAHSGLPLGERMRGDGVRSLLAVPVISRDHVLGAVCAYWDEVHEVGEREIRLLSTLARQAAIAVDNARLVGDIRRTLDDLKAAQDSLIRGATLRAVGELAAGAAHHLNNLLAVVLGRTQLLLMRNPPEPMVASLRTIERAVVDAADTVRRIQAFSRTDTGDQAQEFDLDAVIRDALDVTRPRWEHEAQVRGARIEVSFEAGGLPRLSGRAAEIREAVANLILNAVDAMPAGGRLRIRTWREGARAHVAVTDTGVGMTEAVRRRVFEPFFTTKGVKSTGLGLPVAYGIVRRHGGEIALESREGEGTTVSFWLPTGAGAAAAEAPAGAVPILVIDDEAAVRELLTEILNGRGHAVTTAVGGRDGLERFRGGRFGLVITDLGMPDMTGWDVARAVNAASPATPVLVLTGWGEMVQAPDGVRVAGIVTKPFDVGRLTSAVSDALRASR